MAENFQVRGAPLERVLVIGEALIDIVRRVAGPADEHVGGSPANVALGLGRLGVPVRLRTALGADARGERIAQHLVSSGVDVDPASWRLNRTSTATAQLAGNGAAVYAFDIDWRLDEPVELGDARVVHVGSIGCYMEPGASQVLHFIRSLPESVHLTF
ncbi:PfkB family carbohydrate kinase, partial [Glutamicibacter protophormiae]|uniref:PfkB family carbohydrate kinase n=1 Tax=Glutamicibacter protophormiae TaxID=37930 RepID=UPI003A8CFB32